MSTAPDCGKSSPGVRVCLSLAQFGIVAVVLACAGLEASEPLYSSETKATVNEAGELWDCVRDRDKYVLWDIEIGGHAGEMRLSGKQLFVGGNIRLGSEADKDLATLVSVSTDGKRLWERQFARLKHRDNDWPVMPIRSRPVCDGGCVFYVNNRGELVCDEMKSGRERWKLDMVKDLGVYKRNESEGMNQVSSLVVHGDYVYCGTGNASAMANSGSAASDEIGFVPSPEAPSLIAVEKATGKLAWTSNAPGDDIIYGQWSSPMAATVGKETRIIYCAGDGWVYGHDPTIGKTVWQADPNGPDAKPWKRGEAGTRQSFVADPVIDGRLFVASESSVWVFALGTERKSLAGLN